MGYGQTKGKEARRAKSHLDGVYQTERGAPCLDRRLLHLSCFPIRKRTLSSDIGGLPAGEITDEQKQEVGEFLQAIEDHDDVHRIWAALK